MATHKPPITRKTKKPPRSREYTGPNTIEGVRAYLKTNALQKAKDKAFAALPREDQIKLFESARKRALDALDLSKKRMDALARERGFKVSDE
jgi:hypothetical protein